jgi:hypothetical protein
MFLLCYRIVVRCSSKAEKSNESRQKLRAGDDHYKQTVYEERIRSNVQAAIGGTVGYPGA